jgi:hypothetical protein
LFVDLILYKSLIFVFFFTIRIDIIDVYWGALQLDLSGTIADLGNIETTKVRRKIIFNLNDVFFFNSLELNKTVA